MRVGVVITLYNRPELTSLMLKDLVRSEIPPDTIVILVDDCSTDPAAIKLFEEFECAKFKLFKFHNKANEGIRESLRTGIGQAFLRGCEVVTNLDNDVRLRKDWLVHLLDLQKWFPGEIITGFHSTTRNADGTERHRIIHYTHDENFCVKESVGGINMMFNRSVYGKYILPALLNPTGNWDHQACLEAGKVICAVPSLIQHTGVTNSALGHTREVADTAADFVYDTPEDRIELPDVTLIGIDCVDPERLLEAANISRQHIQFGDVKILGNFLKNEGIFYAIKWIQSKAEYSQFVLFELNRYINTKYALIFQADGYVVNPKAWSKDFLLYDYIGATWGYKDNMNVGNGGFSLRSRRLLNILATDPVIASNYEPHIAEDTLICRTCRSYLERKHDIKFAPEEVANRFSIEAFNAAKAFDGANQYSGQFGFHGWQVSFTGASIPNVPKRPTYVQKQ